MKSVLAIAALAAALSTAAFAADVKSTQPTPMTDAQMDAVTAGTCPNLGAGYGLCTASYIDNPAGLFNRLKTVRIAIEPLGRGKATADCKQSGSC
jgi:opacity protein-like surface antigen